MDAMRCSSVTDALRLRCSSPEMLFVQDALLDTRLVCVCMGGKDAESICIHRILFEFNLICFVIDLKII